MWCESGTIFDASMGVEHDDRIGSVFGHQVAEPSRPCAASVATFREQVDLGAQMVINNERLLAGESQRFSAGESSLFLVNAREVPLIDTRIRQVDLEARLRKAYFSLDHEAGTLWSAWKR